MPQDTVRPCAIAAALSFTAAAAVGAVNQPREIVIADLTSDGRQDLVLVVHDRVLLYPQTE